MLNLLRITWYSNFERDQGGQSLFSYAGLDVHMLRDAARPSRDLRPMLRVTFFDTVANANVDIPGNDARLAAELDGGALIIAPQHPLTQGTHNVDVNPASGIVTASANNATVRLSNFIVKVTAKPKTAGFDSQHAYIRFHLHDALSPGTLRLTPDAITANQDMVRGQGFSVLGQFSDGVVADLTNHPDLSWQLFQDDAAGNPQPVAINPTTGGYSVTGFALTGQTGAFQASGPVDRPVHVKGLIPPLNSTAPPASAEAFGDIIIGPRWQRQLPARHIAGPGPAARARVPNLLFLSDGFLAEQQETFFSVAQQLVQLLRDAKTAFPLDRLLRDDGLNVFAAFVPSRQSGVTVSHGLVPISPAKVACTGLPTPYDTAESATDFVTDIGDLVYWIGMPVPGDAPQPGETPTQVFNRVRDKVLALFPQVLANRLSVTMLQELHLEWLALANHTLAIEHDTTFAATAGQRPAAEGDDSQHLTWHPLRVSQDDLLRLLAGVVEVSTATPIGDLWIADRKDRTLVTVLCAGAGNLGTNVPNALGPGAVRTFFLGLGKYIMPVWTKTIAGSLMLESDPLPVVEPFASTLGDFLHEIGHSLELGDEYDHRPEEFAPANERQVSFQGNLVPETVLVLPAGTDFHMNNAVWGAFPRIRAAGVLRDPLVREAGGTPTEVRYRVPLMPGHAKAFVTLSVPQFVALRPRPLIGAMSTLAPNARGNARFQTVACPLLTVDSVDVSADVVTIKGPPIPTALETFLTTQPPATLKRPMLYAPTLSTASQPLPLTAQVIADMIEGPSRPMNRAAGSCQTEHFSDIKKPFVKRPWLKVVSFPGGLVNDAVVKAQSKRLVGLVDGGNNFACKIFHPTVRCLMDRAMDDEFRVPTRHLAMRNGGLLQYCHVCRYLIVDYLDPTLHAAIDAEYDKIYPVPL